MKNTLLMIALKVAYRLAKRIDHPDVAPCVEMTLADVRFWLNDESDAEQADESEYFQIVLRGRKS